MRTLKVTNSSTPYHSTAARTYSSICRPYLLSSRHKFSLLTPSGILEYRFCAVFRLTPGPWSIDPALVVGLTPGSCKDGFCTVVRLTNAYMTKSLCVCGCCCCGFTTELLLLGGVVQVQAEPLPILHSSGVPQPSHSSPPRMAQGPTDPPGARSLQTPDQSPSHMLKRWALLVE